MQTLTSALNTAQNSYGQQPYIQASAYNDQIVPSLVSNSQFSPGANETVISSDSCVMNSPTAGKGIMSVVVTTNSSTKNYTIYWRFIIEANFGTAGSWNTYNTLLTVSNSGNNNAWLNVAVTSDNFQNTTSDYLTISYGYLNYDGVTNYTWNIVAKVYKFTGISTITLQNTYSIAEVTAESVAGLNFFSVYSFFIGVSFQSALSACFDSVKGYGYMFYQSNYAQGGQTSSNYEFLGDYTLKFGTMAGATSGLGTDGTSYVLPLKVNALSNGLSLIEENGLIYGAILGYRQDISGNALTTFTFNIVNGEFSEGNLIISGPQDFSQASSSVVYGPQFMKLSLARYGFDPSQYPTRTLVFILTYAYYGLGGVVTTESIQSTDFLHWGDRRIWDASNLKQIAIHSIDSYYVMMYDNNQTAYYVNRSVVTTDISGDIITMSTNRQNGETPASLSMTLVNNYLGSGASKSTTLAVDNYIKASWGFVTADGRGAGDLYALSLNGSQNGNIVDASSLIVPNYPFTISFWLYRTSNISYSFLVGYGNSNSPTYAFAVGVGATIQFLTGDSFSSGFLNGATTINNNTLYHIAVTYDGSTRKIYINGILDASDSRSISLVYNHLITNNLTIGYTDVGGVPLYLTGQIDELKFFHTALSSTDIADLYAGSYSTTSPYAYYKFDEGSGTTLTESQGTGLNGTTNGTYAPVLEKQSLTDGWYLVEHIIPSTGPAVKSIAVDGRDAMKHIASSGFNFPLQLESQTQLKVTSITDQLFSNVFAPIVASGYTNNWTYDSTTLYDNLTVANQYELLAITQGIGPSFQISADFTFGSTSGPGINIPSSQQFGFDIDIYKGVNSTFPYGFIQIACSTPVQVSGTTYKCTASIFCASAYSGSQQTSQAQTINFNITQPFNFKVKRIGPYLMVYINNTLCSFPSFYTDMGEKSFNVPTWVGNNVYVLDNTVGQAIITNQVGVFSQWNSGSAPPGGGSTPQTTITNIKLIDYDFVRSQDYNLTDLATLGGVASVVTPNLFSDNFASLSNWTTIL